jgi:SAM-dependent methyltransferase
VATTLPAEPARSEGVPRVERRDLERIFALKYGGIEPPGWGPRMRRRFGYFTPDDHYEALVDQLVVPGCAWLDVGCGREVFPNNQDLARELAARCGHLAGVDPDAGLDANPFVHARARVRFEDYAPDRPFDLVTLRMVAEHVDEPERVMAAIARALRPGGLAVIYTVNRWSPVPILTTLVPMPLRHPVKRFLWRTAKRDTFPTRFRMNTRRRLDTLARAAGLAEASFTYLDDCRTFARFRGLQWLELGLRRALRGVGLAYPERCLLGVYRRR